MTLRNRASTIALSRLKWSVSYILQPMFLTRNFSQPAIGRTQPSVDSFSSTPRVSMSLDATSISAPSTDQRFGYQSSSFLSPDSRDIWRASGTDIQNRDEHPTTGPIRNDLPGRHYRVSQSSRSHPSNRTGSRLQRHSTQDEFLRSKYPQDRRYVLDLTMRFRDKHDATEPIPHDLIDGLLEVTGSGKYQCFCCPGKKRARTITPARDHVRKSLGNFPFRCPNAWWYVRPYWIGLHN